MTLISKSDAIQSPKQSMDTQIEKKWKEVIWTDINKVSAISRVRNI